ncbi:2-hydroxyacid dehydrogenase [Arsukibacterium sp.]|uniref:2-hydroxyacid dehydrogenase n=1 Tax=Arsukibacterium sp. TaxID=1977258 RepID=UPI002FDAC50C
MAIALIIPDRKLDDLQLRLQQALPQTPIYIWPDIPRPEQVSFAVLWKQPLGALASLPALKALQSFGAGVDGILADPGLPPMPLARIVDPALTKAMINYLDGIESYYRLRLDQFVAQQQARTWRSRSPRRFQRICVLGLGELGAAVATHFLQKGYQISGWSRRPKQLSGVDCYAGLSALPEAFANAQLVICLLPLTPETKQMLNTEVLAMMAPGSIFINVARGAIVDDAALLQALDSGHLAAACLDVFATEPLPTEHPYWQHPAVLVTPHSSAVTRVETVIAQIVDNYQRTEQGLPLLNQVDLSQGY